MRRVEGWREKYDAAMHAALTTPFEWWQHDCVTFAARMLDIQYELGVMAAIRAGYGYNNAKGAIARINAAGGLDVLVTDVLGVGSLPPALLSVGDVALYDYEREDFPHALAVHDGHTLLAPGEHGLVSLPLARALKGWRP